jgi:predicted dehydrogenase
VADLSASRVSRAPVRKLRVFGTNFYGSADLQAPELRVERRTARGQQPGEARTYGAADALRTEIEMFIAAVRGNSPPAVDGAAGRAALALALQVNDGIGERLSLLSRHRGLPLA